MLVCHYEVLFHSCSSSCKLDYWITVYFDFRGPSVTCSAFLSCLSTDSTAVTWYISVSNEPIIARKKRDLSRIIIVNRSQTDVCHSLILGSVCNNLQDATGLQKIQWQWVLHATGLTCIAIFCLCIGRNYCTQRFVILLVRLNVTGVCQHVLNAPPVLQIIHQKLTIAFWPLYDDFSAGEVYTNCIDLPITKLLHVYWNIENRLLRVDRSSPWLFRHKCIFGIGEFFCLQNLRCALTKPRFLEV